MGIPTDITGLIPSWSACRPWWWLLLPQWWWQRPPQEQSTLASSEPGAEVPHQRLVHPSDQLAVHAVRQYWSPMRCRDPFGLNSAQMLRTAEEFLAAIPDYPVDRYHGRGVVLAGGGERYFPSLYVSIRALRHVGCRLPIQVWYLGRNNEMPADRQALLGPYGVECIDADAVRRHLML